MTSNTGKDQPNQEDLIWTITVADWRDYTQLQNLEQVCFNDDDSWPFWDLIGVLTLPGTVRLKAVVDGQMVGFIGGEREAGKHLGWVTTLGVMPAFRRYGIGRALLHQCEKDLAMPAIRLSVRASNTSAIRLYENTGYEVVDQWKKYYNGGEDALVFEKRR